ncbi:MAG TPA: M28 family peptidase [Mycobacteriales bacterium]|nr:M28 family peptidase [Mycobacteriales bacterium]
MRTKSLALGLAAMLAVAVATVGGPASAAAAKGPRTLKDYARPTVTGAQILDGVAKFSSDFPLRVTATPTQVLARGEIAREATALGYSVTISSYPGVLEAVVAVKPGLTKPDERIVFGTHFDVVPQAVQGAYDNGTGTRMLMDLARSYAKVRTHRTLVFAWFNGEEEGALASDAMAKDYKARGFKVKAYLGFDMVGIAYPVRPPLSDKNCLCMWRGAKDEVFDRLLADVNYGFLKFPKGRQLVSIEGRNVRNSDEASFADAGFPTLRWAGMRKAADYPQYHLPQDNLETMTTVAGGRPFLEAGLHNTLLSAYYTAAALDLQK